MVTPQAPYLGGTVGAARYQIAPPGSSWSPPMISAIRQHTSANAMKKATTRMSDLRGAASRDLRGQHWNTYIPTLFPYPSNICLPPDNIAQQIEKAAHRFVSAPGWPPRNFGPGITNLFTLKHGPRHPIAGVQAAAVITWIQDDQWAAPAITDDIPTLWNHCLTWARCPHPQRADGCLRGLTASKLAIIHLHQRFQKRARLSHYPTCSQRHP